MLATMKPKPVHTFNSGSIWIAAIASMLSIAPDESGLLYLSDDGCLLLVQDADDAPPSARFVSMLDPQSNSLRIAARLAQVAAQ